MSRGGRKWCNQDTPVQLRCILAGTWLAICSGLKIPFPVHAVHEVSKLQRQEASGPSTTIAITMRPARKNVFRFWSYIASSSANPSATPLYIYASSFYCTRIKKFAPGPWRGRSRNFKLSVMLKFQREFTW